MPQHFTFVMEQTLGHVPFAKNLKKVVEADSEVNIDWLEVNFSPQNKFDKLPVIKNNWSLRGSLQARRLLNTERKKSGLSDLYFFHTQVVSLLSSGWLPKETPVVISLDATPINYDEIGLAYGHSASNQPAEKFKFWLNRRALHHATRLVTWSEWARQSLINDYGVEAQKVEVIPPGTDMSFWQPDLEAKKSNHSHAKLRLLFVGGDFERKGGQLLYETFRRDLSDLFELHLVTQGQVAPGDGVYVYKDIRPNSAELQALFRQADVFVLPTYGDCLSLAIVEAMAANLPIVSTNVGATSEAVENGENGFLTTPGNATELTQVLRQLATNPELRQQMGDKSRKKAELNFDASKNGLRLLEICKRSTASK